MNIINGSAYHRAAYAAGWTYNPVYIYGPDGNPLPVDSRTIVRGDRVAVGGHIHFVLNSQGKNAVKMVIDYLYLLRGGVGSGAVDRVRKNAITFNNVPKLEYVAEDPNSTLAAIFGTLNADQLRLPAPSHES